MLKIFLLVLSIFLLCCFLGHCLQTWSTSNIVLFWTMCSIQLASAPVDVYDIQPRLLEWHVLRAIDGHHILLHSNLECREWDWSANWLAWAEWYVNIYLALSKDADREKKSWYMRCVPFKGLSFVAKASHVYLNATIKQNPYKMLTNRVEISLKK